MEMSFSPTPPNRFRPSERWEFFDIERTNKAGGDYLVLYGHLSNFSYDGGSTPRDIIEKIASREEPKSSRCFRIDSLDESLHLPKDSRGGVVFGWTGDLIDQYVSGYAGLRWWMTKRGLVIAAVGPEDLPISDFNREAGELMKEHLINGKLPYAALVEIAAKLDTADYDLKEHLQPAHWKEIAEHNKRYTRSPVRTFSEAIKNKRFVRGVRKRLYYARDRFELSHHGAHQ
jgi:hypothetical protein